MSCSKPPPLDFDQLPHGTYRVIQFKSQGFADIAENLSLIFPGIIKVKQLSATSGIAIEKMSTDRLSEVEIKQGLLTDIEAQDLITQLYKNDGNQLKTAKAMYIHRNTLTQKIKKFERQYGLTLSGSDLVLLYSLI